MIKTEVPSKEVDIAIVGGGMVGLTLALALAETELSIVLIDGQESPKNTVKEELKLFDSRVSALTLASRNLLDSIGVWSAMPAERVCAYTDMSVWDAEGTGSIDFSCLQVGQDCLGYIVENRTIITTLYDLLATKKNVQLVQPAKLKSILPEYYCRKHLLTVDSGEQLSCSLIVGADGANSMVRAESGFNTREWGYQQQAIVATVKTELEHGQTARQRFLTSGPLALLPLAMDGDKSVGQHYSSVVWSCDSDMAVDIMELDDEMFCQALGRAFEHKLGDIENTSQRFSFPLKQMHAEEYVKDGIVLLGDAAHTIHPLAGQGVNLGFMDVEVLSETIKAALQNDEDYSSAQILSRYQRKRKKDNIGMMVAMEGFKRLFGSEDLILRWLRNAGLRTIDNIPLIKNELVAKAIGL